MSRHFPLFAEGASLKRLQDRTDERRAHHFPLFAEGASLKLLTAQSTPTHMMSFPPLRRGGLIEAGARPRDRHDRAVISPSSPRGPH